VGAGQAVAPTSTGTPARGGTRYVDDRAVFTAIAYVLTTGRGWRHLPAEFGVSEATVHHRFVKAAPSRKYPV
jgi:transposase